MSCKVAVAGCTLAACLAFAAPLPAAPLTFHVDSTQSHFTFSLQTDEGITFTAPQTPGSDTTSLSGTLKVDVQGGSIKFLPTADIQFALQPLPQQPLFGGAAGSSPAQIGLTVNVPGGLITGVLATRNYVGDVTSAPIAWSGGAFDGTQLLLAAPSENTSYNLVVLGSPYVGDLNGNTPALNQQGGATLSLAGGVYTLSIPFLLSAPDTLMGISYVTVLSGQLVATAIVPEPGGLALAATGLVIAAAMISMARWRAGMR